MYADEFKTKEKQKLTEIKKNNCNISFWDPSGTSSYIHEAENFWNKNLFFNFFNSKVEKWAFISLILFEHSTYKAAVSFSWAVSSGGE